MSLNRMDDPSRMVLILDGQPLIRMIVSQLMLLVAGC